MRIIAIANLASSPHRSHYPITSLPRYNARSSPSVCFYASPEIMCPPGIRCMLPSIIQYISSSAPAPPNSWPYVFAHPSMRQRLPRNQNQDRGGMKSTTLLLPKCRENRKLYASVANDLAPEQLHLPALSCPATLQDPALPGDWVFFLHV